MTGRYWAAFPPVLRPELARQGQLERRVPTAVSRLKSGQAVLPPLFDQALAESRAAESTLEDDVMPLEKAPGKILQATKVAVPRTLERFNQLV